MFVFLNKCEESRIICDAVPARDPSAATLCLDDTRRLGKLLYYYHKKSEPLKARFFKFYI